MAASILALPLCFAPSDDFSGFVVAATLAYPVGEFACSALRACTRIHEAQAVVGAPFVTAGAVRLVAFDFLTVSFLSRVFANFVVLVNNKAGAASARRGH